MILSHIAAMAKNRVIGKDNKLPWHLPEDLRFFKKMTDGRIMIMGRKTFESLPGHLPNRHHIIVSRSHFVADEGDVDFVSSIDEALKLAEELIADPSEEVFIVGGGEIYKQTLDKVDRIYLTVIDQEVEGDAKYPEFDESRFILEKDEGRPGPPPFAFRTYVRK
ncbi:MAG: dihydrofolate reductase [Bdellovibrionaceae bacterium]|nr:dihydrofolate reductase [Pseudobdellovibrionaceae bacterium]